MKKIYNVSLLRSYQSTNKTPLSKLVPKRDNLTDSEVRVIDFGLQAFPQINSVEGAVYRQRLYFLLFDCIAFLFRTLNAVLPAQVVKNTTS